MATQREILFSKTKQKKNNQTNKKNSRLDLERTEINRKQCISSKRAGEPAHDFIFLCHTKTVISCLEINQAFYINVSKIHH